MTRLVVNCASTWANQTSGSAGQKGGSFRLTAETKLEVGAVEELPEVDPLEGEGFVDLPELSPLDIVLSERQGHQCRALC